MGFRRLCKVLALHGSFKDFYEGCMELFTGVCQDLGYPAAHVDARVGGTERAWTFLDRRIMQPSWLQSLHAGLRLPQLRLYGLGRRVQGLGFGA